MGSLYSYMKESAEIIESVEQTEKEAEALPTKVLKNKRLLELDPRSPSALIARTPIVVDKTPRSSLSSQSSLQSAVVQGSPMEVDPRSPSCKFMRTPIQPNHRGTNKLSTGESFSSTTAVDPRSPTNEFLRTPIVPQYRPEDEIDEEEVEDDSRPVSLCYSMESGFNSADVTPETRSQNPSVISSGAFSQTYSPDSVVSSEEPSLISPENLPLPVGDTPEIIGNQLEESGDISELDVEDLSKLPTEIENISLTTTTEDVHQETPKAVGGLRCRGMDANKKRQGLLQLNSGSVRSPLTLVHNSPHIVAPQQSRIPRYTKPASLTSPSDKENCISNR